MRSSNQTKWSGGTPRNKGFAAGVPRRQAYWQFRMQASRRSLALRSHSRCS